MLDVGGEAVNAGPLDARWSPTSRKAGAVDRHNPAASGWHTSVATSRHTQIAPDVRVGQVWEQMSKHERRMLLEVLRPTGRRGVLRPVGGGPSKKRGLREGPWTLSAEPINATCRLVREAE
jgi:hypothetical protein